MRWYHHVIAWVLILGAMSNAVGGGPEVLLGEATGAIAISYFLVWLGIEFWPGGSASHDSPPEDPA